MAIDGKKNQRKVMSVEHKEALSIGRVQSAAVRRYLEIALVKPKRGRKRTAASVALQIEKLNKIIDSPSTGVITKLKSLSERAKLQDELTRINSATNTKSRTEIEGAFIEHAKAYSEAHGIQKKTWLEIGVDPKILAKAGIR